MKRRGMKQKREILSGNQHKKLHKYQIPLSKTGSWRTLCLWCRRWGWEEGSQGGSQEGGGGGGRNDVSDAGFFLPILLGLCLAFLSNLPQLFFLSFFPVVLKSVCTPDSLSLSFLCYCYQSQADEETEQEGKSFVTKEDEKDKHNWLHLEQQENERHEIQQDYQTILFVSFLFLNLHLIWMQANRLYSLCASGSFSLKLLYPLLRRKTNPAMTWKTERERGRETRKERGL